MSSYFYFLLNLYQCNIQGRQRLLIFLEGGGLMYNQFFLCDKLNIPHYLCIFFLFSMITRKYIIRYLTSSYMLSVKYSDRHFLKILVCNFFSPNPCCLYLRWVRLVIKIKESKDQ